jgi:hypothetical protein
MIKLSKHTADEMGGGSALPSYIEDALAAPDRVSANPTDPSLSRSYKAIVAFGSRVAQGCSSSGRRGHFRCHRALGQRSQAMIHASCDPEANVLHVKFGPDDAKYDGSQEVAPGVFLEFDTDGKTIGIGIISVRLRGIDARELESLL